MCSENFDDIRMDYNRLNILSLNNDSDAMVILAILGLTEEFKNQPDITIDSINLLYKAASVGDMLSSKILQALETKTKSRLESLVRDDLLDRFDYPCARYCNGRFWDMNIEFYAPIAAQGFLPAAVRVERLKNRDKHICGSDFDFDGKINDVKLALDYFRKGIHYFEIADKICNDSNFDDVYWNEKAAECMEMSAILGYIPALNTCYNGEWDSLGFNLHKLNGVDSMLEYISKTNDGYFNINENMDEVKSRAQKFLPNPYVEYFLSQIQI